MSDEELIAMCEFYIGDMEAVDRGDDPDGTRMPTEVWWAIFETQPATLAGVVAKARVAVLAAADNLTEEVCRNLVALAG